MTAQPRAAIYCRVSTKGQEERGTSLASQEAECRAYGTAHSYIVDEAHVYRETFTGIELWDRPHLTRLRDVMKRKVVQAVIVHAIDRLSRDPVHLGIIIEEAERAGVAVLFVTEPLDDSPEGQLVRFIRGYGAKIEHAKIRERNVRGRRTRLLEGKINNFGTDRYGYRRDRDRGVRLIHEPEAAIVRDIFQMVATDGLSLRAIGRALDERGVPVPSVSKGNAGTRPITGHWRAGTIRCIIRDPAYKGETLAWRVPGADPIRLPEGTTPPIVSPEVWQEAQHRLDINKGEATRNRARPYLLRGLIRCVVCGSRMCTSVANYSERSRKFGYYRCASYDTPAGVCGAKLVRADHIEAWVWEYVCSVLRDPKLITDELERRQANGPDPALTASLESAQRHLAKIERQQQKAVHAFTALDDKQYPLDLLQRELARLQQERDQVQATIADLERRLIRQQRQRDQLQTLTTYCERVAQRLDAFTFEEKRLALSALGVRVVANGKNWYLTGEIRPSADVVPTHLFKEAVQNDSAPAWPFSAAIAAD